MKKTKNSKKTSKVKKIVTISKIINNNKNFSTETNIIENIIPEEYTKLYNSLLYKIRRYPFNELFSTIKFEISELQYDDEDNFYPYKCYIYLNNNDNKMKFEIFLSTIICKYTMRSIDTISNNNLNNDTNNLLEDIFYFDHNFQENILDTMPKCSNKFIVIYEKKIYEKIKGYNKVESIINEILSQYKIIYLK